MTTAYPFMANEFSNPPAFERGVLARSRSGQSPAALEITSVLQTTLDVGELVSLFMRELLNHVEFDGIQFHDPARRIDLKYGEQTRFSLTYSLSIEETGLGELNFFRRFAFKPSEIRVIENLMAALLYPLRNSLAYQQALRSALVDPLTGTNNRSAMDVVLKREVDLSNRQGMPLSIILLDIDHFKKVNDTYGHSAGDVCLQSVAHCVEDSIRGSDLLFRCGGEEFLVLLSQTGKDGALQLAERIRRHVQDLELPSVGGRRLSISLGVTQIQSGDSVRALYDRADKALYAAKDAGRNTVKFL